MKKKKNKNITRFTNAFGYIDNTPAERIWWINHGHELNIRDEKNHLRKYESKKGYDGGEG